MAFNFGCVVSCTEGLGVVASSEVDEDGNLDVCLRSGITRKVPAASLESPGGLLRPGLGGGPETFDVLLGPNVQESHLGEEVAACLFEKGFCVLQQCKGSDSFAGALEELRSMSDSERLHRLPDEVEQGYLGSAAKGRTAWLTPSIKQVDIETSDDFASLIASSVQPHCSDMLGCFVDERTPGLLSLSLMDEDEGDWPNEDADDQVLGDFLRTWTRSQIRIVHFMGPGDVSIILENNGSDAAATLPRRQDVMEITARSGTVLVYRTTVFNYECRALAEYASLTVNLLEHSEPLELTNFVADDEVILAAATGPPGPRGEQICIMNEATRLMCNFDEVEGYRAGLAGGTDGGIEIPIMRWDAVAYYNPDDETRRPGQTYIKHQSYVEGLELFDNKYFDITSKDAAVMDPMQRHVLEVGAMNLYKMGITKKVANRKAHHAGVSVGLDKDDWDKQAAEMFGCTGGNNVQAIISNRFSFVFNLRGPNYVADTACSASLAATHMAKFALRDTEIEKLEFHLALGIHQCFLPWGFEGLGSRMQNERCYTFNDTANGYMRGDGCSAIVLQYGELAQEREAVWRASRVGQNGRSATLTAPNGLAQEEVIMKAVKEAKMSTAESTIWNCHGTGTALGDPIEVGGVRRVQTREARSTALLMCTNKPVTGHLEGGAAMTTLIAATLQVKSGCSVGFPHLGQLNPNLDSTSFEMCLTNEVVYSGFGKVNVHISSFGFGGTNAHAILWGGSQSDAIDSSTMILQKIRKMAPPEVRVNGDDPSMWEWDGPDVTIKPGDKYSLSLELEDSAVRWTKEELPTEEDDVSDFYCIVGPFNDWEGERMEEDASISGLRSIIVDVPESGELQWRFLKNGEEDQVIYPEYDQCNRKSAEVLGPAQEDDGRENNVWSVRAPSGQLLQIGLLVAEGCKTVCWMAAG